MVIYEVNITIENKIYDTYYSWLLKHIETMLTFRGFQQAEVAEEKIDTHELRKLTVRYSIECEQDLEHYLKNHAEKMRSDAITTFGDQFSAFRRIFLNPVAVKKHNV